MLNIVYDMDDVLINLNNTVCDMLKIPLSTVTLYEIKKCPFLSDDEKERMLKAYAQVETFQLARFNPGATRICDVQASGEAEVFIHSTSLTQEIADLKYQRLTSTIPGLKGTNINLVSGTHKKPEFVGADTIVEDSLENILKYPETTIKILVDMPYNQYENYGVDSSKHRIIRVTDLNSAVNMVDALVEYYRLGKNMQKVFSM